MRKFWTLTHLLVPIVSNLHTPSRGSVENHQFHWACCRGEGLQRHGWLAAALPTCTWVCLWKDRTGRNEGTAMSIAPKWEKQTFLVEVSLHLFFPLNSFPSVNLPYACMLCSHANLSPCKYFSIFPLHVPQFWLNCKLAIFLHQQQLLWQPGI